MGKTNFQYDETGNTYYYVFLTFLGMTLLPCTYYFWPSWSPIDESIEKKKKYIQVAAKDTVYYQVSPTEQFTVSGLKKSSIDVSALP